MERVIAHPRSMIGSDGLPHDRHPHPRLWGPRSRACSRAYWRERKLFTLEQAVHKMSGLTAAQLPHRRPRSAAGLPSAMADVVRVRLRAHRRHRAFTLYDDPIRTKIVGITAVYVNGVRSYAEGVGSSALARAGRMLARPA